MSHHASHRSVPSAATPRILRTWSWGVGVRAMLLQGGSGLELRVISDDLVIRRGHYLDIRQALKAAQEWRVEYEMERPQFTNDGNLLVCCPECGDDASERVPRHGNHHWFHCQTCGAIWKHDGA